MSVGDLTSVVKILAIWISKALTSEGLEIEFICLI